MNSPPERLGSFYLGAEYDLETGVRGAIVNYDARDLTTHAVCLGMTGSGKTGLCIVLLEEAALDSVPAIIIDPKGDVTNLVLQFQSLRPEDFRPWVNPDDARRKGRSIEEYAVDMADLWRKGLEEWGIDAERIGRMKNTTDFTIFTPGSNAGVPINILGSLAAPGGDFLQDIEENREKIGSIVAALLGFAGVDADPVRSREAVLLSAIFESFWGRNLDLTLEKLISAIQKPPMNKIGVFDLDTFYPERKRMELAMAFNILVASPSFQSWTQGEPMDVSRLLFTDDAKPRHSIIYIAHLSDRERMFFVTLLLENILTWVRRQTGTTSLRALLYFDEVFGFMPPVAEPPSKRPLLTLMKQARAFGFGVVLTTQNPVDIDYKGLTNAGTWLIGKLQAERDKEHSLEGLRGAIKESGGDVTTDYSSIVNKLTSRIFLMHNVHEDKPKVFQSRWAMSFLRGPLTKPQIADLTEEHKLPLKEGEVEEPRERTVQAMQPHAAEIVELEEAGLTQSPPYIDPSIAQVFLPMSVDDETAILSLSAQLGRAVHPEKIILTYEPSIIGVARVRFADRKRNIESQMESVRLAPIPEGLEEVSWDQGSVRSIRMGDLKESPPQTALDEGPYFHPIPRRVNSAQEIRAIAKGFVDWIYGNERLELKAHPELGVTQQAGESELEFKMRLQQASRERRDKDVETLEQKYSKRLDALNEKLRRLERGLASDEAEYEARKREEVIGVGETVLGFMLGRRRTSAATTIATRRRMTSKVKLEMEQSKDEIAKLRTEITNLEGELEEAVKEITDRRQMAKDEVTVVEVKPIRADIDVKMVTLAWVPYWLIRHREGSAISTVRIPGIATA